MLVNIKRKSQKIAVIYLMICFIEVISCVSAHAAQVAVMGLSAVAALKSMGAKSFFKPSGGVNIERIMFITKKNMNNGAAVKVHLVVVYDKELLAQLAGMKAAQYFKAIKQLVKDHPNKMKILQYSFVAKDWHSEWIDLSFENSTRPAEKIMMYANYSSADKDHRLTLPNEDSDIKIVFGKDDFECINKTKKPEEDDKKDE